MTRKKVEDQIRNLGEGGEDDQAGGEDDQADEDVWYVSEYEKLSKGLEGLWKNMARKFGKL